jgi:hypothetical protein
MIAPDRAQRFSSYDELVAELEWAQLALGGAANGSRRQRRARLAFLITAASLMLIIAAAAIFFLIQKPPARAPARTVARSPVQSVRKTEKEQVPAHGTVSATGGPGEAKNTRDLEAALWNRALATYKEQLALYNFAAAAEAIKNVRLSDPSLNQAKGTVEKKAQWLIDWKSDLIKDLNNTHFSGALTDRNGEQFAGIAGATDESLSLKLRYGIARVAWTEVSPQDLLTISTSFIEPSTPDAADRQWRCAVFASETGQAESARQLANAAAKIRPEYREQISVLFADIPEPR